MAFSSEQNTSGAADDVRAAFARCGSASSLGRAVGVTPKAAGDWIHGRSEPSLDNRNRMRLLLGLEPVDEPAPRTTKRCPKCTRDLSVNDFYKVKKKSGRIELQGYCKRCIGRHSVKYRKVIKGDGYRLHINDYNAMRAAQQYRCAICRRHESEIQSNSKKPDRKLHIDHCHRSGKIRALLCPRCNIRVGFVEGDPSLLSATFAYVAQHVHADQEKP